MLWNRALVLTVLVLLGFSCVVVLTLIFCLSACCLYICLASSFAWLRPPSPASSHVGLHGIMGFHSPSPHLLRGGASTFWNHQVSWAKRITSCGLSAFNGHFLLYWVAMGIFTGFLERICFYFSVKGCICSTLIWKKKK